MVLNKADLPVGISHAEIEMVMALPELVLAAKGLVTVFETSAMDGIDSKQVGGAGGALVSLLPVGFQILKWVPPACPVRG